MKKADVLNYFGSQSVVAAALGTSAAAISKWPEIIPKVRAYELEQLTNGALMFDAAMYQKTALVVQD